MAISTRTSAKGRQPGFTVYESADGWRWRLKAANGRIIATGEAHTRKADAERAVQTVCETCCGMPNPVNVRLADS